MIVQAKLLEIHRKTKAIRDEKRDTELVLALNRSDYMLDEPSGTLMQVSPAIVPFALLFEVAAKHVCLTIVGHECSSVECACVVYASLHMLQAVELAAHSDLRCPSDMASCGLYSPL